MEPSDLNHVFKVLSEEIKEKLYVNNIWEPRKWRANKELRERINNTELGDHKTLDEKICALRTNTLIRPKCLVCGGHVNLSQGKYNDTCSVKCGANNPKVKEKTRQTNKVKYDGHFTQNKEWISNFVSKMHTQNGYAKGQKTFTERYGVKNRFQLTDVKEKIKLTNITKFGVENPQQNINIRNKTQKTNLIRYGKSHTFPVFNGEDNPMNHYSVKFASRVTKLSKVDWNKFPDNFNFISILLSNHIKTCKCCNRIYSTPILSGRCRCTIKTKENEVFMFINSLVNAKANDRIILDGLEIDILCPDQKIGFEFDGVYWHSELVLAKRGVNPKKYHIDKTKLAELKGIKLFHIFENEWDNKQPIIKSIIKSKLGICDRKIYARKCIIRDVSIKDAMGFLQDNHIQGGIGSSIRKGLYFNNELVMLATFGKNRFSKDSIELLRMASILNTTIVGGASKLINDFVKTNNHKIICFCDLRYGTGNVYKQLGFKKINDGAPNYWYLDKTQDKLSSRIKYQKHKLKKELILFDENKSEWENMKMNGFTRIWDCGSSKWLFDPQSSN